MTEHKRSALHKSGVNVFNQNGTPPVPVAPAGAPSSSEASQKPAATKKPAAKAPRQQVKFYADAQLYEEFKIAHRTATTHASISEHLNALIEQELRTLQKKNNGGQPFTS